MAKYCVNKGGDHEVHKIAACTPARLPRPENRIDFTAVSDAEAMRTARGYYSNADGCKHCMPKYHRR